METDTSTHGTTPNAAETHLRELVQATYEKFKSVDDGQVATYIPELGKANPDHFGICLATVDGKVICARHSKHKFTIQSICNPFAFQMALDKHRREPTPKHVGVEPSVD